MRRTFASPQQIDQWIINMLLCDWSSIWQLPSRWNIFWSREFSSQDMQQTEFHSSECFSSGDNMPCDTKTIAWLWILKPKDFREKIYFMTSKERTHIYHFDFGLWVKCSWQLYAILSSIYWFNYYKPINVFLAVFRVNLLLCNNLWCVN